MRLIDADKLRGQMEEESLHLFNAMHKGYSKAMKCARIQPVAYDINKVIEQLKELPQCSTWNLNSDNVSREKVIEIVKRGGIG